MDSHLGVQLVEVQVASKIALADQTNFTFNTIIIRLKTAEKARKTLQLTTEFLGDQLVNSTHLTVELKSTQLNVSLIQLNVDLSSTQLNVESTQLNVESTQLNVESTQC